MKQYLGILLFSIFLANTGRAQTAEDSVKAVVNQLFAAMKSGDAEKLKDCFADSAILQTIGRNGVRTDAVAQFAAQVGKLPKDSAEECITFETIKIDGPLALVWTPYRFYYAGAFSHCGVNSFHLVRSAGRWRIQYLIDTRRRTGCDTN